MYSHIFIGMHKGAICKYLFLVKHFVFGQVDYKLEGRTILHMACHEGYNQLVSSLIDAGADMSLQDDEGDTPLHYAAFG